MRHSRQALLHRRNVPFQDLVQEGRVQVGHIWVTARLGLQETTARALQHNVEYYITMLVKYRIRRRFVIGMKLLELRK